MACKGLRVRLPPAPPSSLGGTVSRRLEALSEEATFSRVVASVGVSWRFGTLPEMRTTSPFKIPISS